jgi:hypothetical protein
VSLKIAVEQPSCSLPTIDAFEAGEIDPDSFDHRVHVFVGWSYLRRYEAADGIHRYSAALRRLTRKLGVPEKYNETITWFFLFLIAERMHSAPSQTWEEFSGTNQDLCNDGGALLRRHYSMSRLQSPQARQSFLLPDKNP